VNEKLKVAIVNVITCLFLALLFELLIYAGLAFPSAIPGFLTGVFREYYREKDRQIIQVTDCARYDSQLFYLFKPGRCMFGNREFDNEYGINSAGLRDDENSLLHPRVIAVGDSYTMGWGVRQDESFPQLLEKQLGTPVLNAGVSSFGTAREMILLKRLALDSVRTVIIQYHGNDFEENQQFLQSGNTLKIRSKASYDSLCKAIERRQKYFPFKHLYGISKAIGKKWLKPMDSAKTQSDEAQAFLKVIRHASFDPAIRVVVFKVDDYKKMNDHFALQLDSLLTTPEYNSLNVQTLKLSDTFQAGDYFVLDDHINKNGHAKIAAKINSRIHSVSP
jgi:hypothetical protein